MRSITLHSCRRICLYQHAKYSSKRKYGNPCSTCCISEICSLFVECPKNWNEYALNSIDKDSESYYKLLKEGCYANI